MDRSMRGDLSRRSKEELEGILWYCRRTKGYDHAVEDVLDELEKRYPPEAVPPHILRIRQELEEKAKENKK